MAEKRFSDETTDKEFGGIVKHEQIYGWEVTVESVALVDAQARSKANPWSARSLQLYSFCLLATLNSCINGYDGMVLGNINSMKPFLEFFDLPPGGGAQTGIFFSIYNIGNIVATPFVGPLLDMWGRRWGMVIGAALIVLGSIVQGASQNRGQFIAARFILGFGVNISASAGPAYVVEIAPPSWRGAVTGVYNTFWFMGAIPASWVTYGTGLYIPDSDNCWRIPLYLQCVFSGFVLIFSLLLPESPRWLFANDHPDEALAILAKYHGEGDSNDPIVQLQIREFQESINREGSDKKWWDYREVFNSKGNLWRLGMVFLMGFIGQWSGNAVITYFMPYALQDAGVKDADTQRLLSALMTVVQFIFALIGASIVDRFGRRTIMFYGQCMFTIYFAIITALSSQYDAVAETFPTTAMSNAVITFIYLFGITYSITITPMQALYPVECLKYETRAKGMALSGLFVGIAGFYNLFVTSIAQVNLGWKYYYWFIAENALAAVIIFFVFVETKGRTLEELEEVFNAPNPNKASRRKHQAEVEKGVGAVAA
ncbi:hypothetical protein H072_10569 [Dactylellina haptotyla CBS 200.50]|uniref:Major facilitator superfamily (MFS) profile domain-containing protein n=1 Tax=Dactylellina haptotyla (strain CBS 200.50) TaxID=1284197 RepID=S8A484_DACHA|nr:hypothetical protein H072_10569 [Dactylellina haptotyla CBS 200.50]